MCDHRPLQRLYPQGPRGRAAERIVRLYGESEKAPEERLKEKDKKRSINYKHFTGREWGDPDNYEIMLRSSAIGVEKCAEILAEICR